ncbi:unnamed protein product [Ilex paraguariensis]|uniref:Cytochrome b561 and DOMON domain-containing protein n=1 Tax=Ilex paraguariensis TaxID=185542 RepID=A0ABC8QQC9_9AQUA
MKASLMSLAFSFLLFGLPLNVNSQSDSCTSTLNPNLIGQLPFDPTSFHCRAVWGAQGYILRYSQTAPTVWSFVVSAPNTNSYVAMGFSPDGNMVGSSAVVGWAADNGVAMMKRYYLGGQSTNLVVPDQTKLQFAGNSSSIITASSTIYMAFQLNTSQPETRLIYAVGPTGILPSPPGFRLTQHSQEISTSINYATGQSQQQSPYASLKRTHGILNMLGWGILLAMGAMAARYLKQWDPIWFYSHTLFQSFGFILGVAGIICGFVLNDRLQSNVNKHKGLGIFILILGCLQVCPFVFLLSSQCSALYP